ncbi:serine aminopeptidase domain-containing protein [Mucilaginibacter jinjuensis]|uniref:Alpha/beta hydrolase n=1 Tax=Mucilaginibacter jinjuensis TaxID=1176721 RepID=A0ABY7T469_9SPHI|nr:alpha/beta hydrolase [Mucilaginibacter jinjuensis]WCT11255.1 alpha/beta hydrolase [Mucilaginibacter jinjuensis]
MKKLLFVFIVIAVNAYAQSEPKNYKVAITRFQQYYNLNQPDSIFSMFSPEVRVSLPEEKNQVMINQLQSQLGRLQQISFVSFDQGVATYKVNFTKSIMAMKVSLNDKDQMGGLLFDNYTSPSDAAKAAEALKRLNVDPALGESTYSVKGFSGSLVGTLTMPANASGKVPVVLIVGASGYTDRNGNNVKQNINANSYKELTVALGKSGIASLRYDKRMVGESVSSTKEDQLHIEDYIEDAMALINKLHDDPRFSKVIVLGHGEGSLVGMIACEETPAGAYISVEGASQPAYLVLKEQAKRLPDYISTRFGNAVDSLARRGKVQQEIDASLYPYIRPSIQPFLLTWMRYAPIKEFKKLKIPVLIVQGSTDLQVKADEGYNFKKAKSEAILLNIPNMNYVLKDAPADKDKNMETYTQPDLPIKPELVTGVVDFINKLK